jgi:hypothetical protein
MDTLTNAAVTVELSTREEMDRKNAAMELGRYFSRPRLRPVQQLTTAKAFALLENDKALGEKAKGFAPVAGSKDIRLCAAKGTFGGRPWFLGWNGTGAFVVEHGGSVMLPEQEDGVRFFTYGPWGRERKVYLTLDPQKLAAAWLKAREQHGLNGRNRNTAHAFRTAEGRTIVKSYSPAVRRLLKAKPAKAGQQ